MLRAERLLLAVAALIAVATIITMAVGVTAPVSYTWSGDDPGLQPLMQFQMFAQHFSGPAFGLALALGAAVLFARALVWERVQRDVE